MKSARQEKQAQEFKICRTCGQRNHSLSGQCAHCGARLYRPRDWICPAAFLLIVVLLICLLVCFLRGNTPMPGENSFATEAIETIETIETIVQLSVFATFQDLEVGY